MNDPMDSPSLEASLDDLKIIYKVLTVHCDDHPELATNGFYASLRRLLEAQATVEGVDIASAGEWEAWLSDIGQPEAEPSSPDLLN